jgi:cell division septum initiation protein DivIVA
MGVRVRHTRPVARKEGESASRIPERGRGVRDVRDRLPEDIRDPFFPAAVRGYDRHAVDIYVERVNGLIAELQISGSPQAAVRHALDRVGEQTSGILQRARETAEEITTGAREEAEETTARAKAEAQDITTDAQRQASDLISRARNEADEIVAGARTEADEILTRAKDQSDNMLARARVEVEQRARQVDEEIASLREDAEARMRSLQADIAAVSDERRTLLDDIRRLAARLEAIVAEAEPAGDVKSSEMPGTPASPAADRTDAIPQRRTNGTDAQGQRPYAARSGPEA